MLLLLAGERDVTAEDRDPAAAVSTLGLGRAVNVLRAGQRLMLTHRHE